MTLKHVSGLKELVAAIKGLPTELGGKALQGAVAAAAGKVRDDVKRRAPVDTGKLREAVYMVRDKQLTTPFRAVYHVGVRAGRKWRSKTLKSGKRTTDRDAFYWRWVEFGTKDQPKRPFLRPGFEAQKDAAVEVIKTTLATRIRRYTARLQKAARK